MYLSTNPDSRIAAVRSCDYSFLVFQHFTRFVGYNARLLPGCCLSNSITLPSQHKEYSIYEGYIYGTPTVNGRSGSVSMSLNNNLEMKIRANTDSTIKRESKYFWIILTSILPIILFVEEFKWSPVNMTGSTRLFNKQVDVRFGRNFQSLCTGLDRQ